MIPDKRIDWRGVAAAFGAAFPAERLHPRTRALFDELAPAEPLAIACSGGADSVALLLALWAAFPARREAMLVLHFNHALRGRASDGDARFVRSLARSLRVRFRTAKWKRASGNADDVSEAEARAARMAFFSEAMSEAGARALALGHQLDDVAETMLMRLARGSGAGGLSAPRPAQRMADGTIRARPLLDARGGELRDQLRSAGAIWREDDSNASDRFFRNRVRRRVLPRLLEASPGDALAGFAASRAQLEEDDFALDAWLAEILGRHENVDTADFARLKGRPAALVRRAVRRWLAARDLAASLGRAAVERIVHAIGEGGNLELNGGANRRVSIKRGLPAIVLEKPRRAAEADEWRGAMLEPGGEVVGASGDRLSLRKLRAGPGLFARLAAGRVEVATTAIVAPPGGWDGRFFVRGRQPGDRFRPLGAPGRTSVQDLLVNRKVPRELRNRLPVIVDSAGAVVWVPGAPPAQEFAVQPDSKTVVQLTYTRPAGNVP